MKATWRSKALAYKALESGFDFVLITRANGVYAVELVEIIAAPLHSKVDESYFPPATVKRKHFTDGCLSFRDFMKL